MPRLRVLRQAADEAGAAAAWYEQERPGLVSTVTAAEGFCRRDDHAG